MMDTIMEGVITVLVILTGIVAAICIAGLVWEFLKHAWLFVFGPYPEDIKEHDCNEIIVLIEGDHIIRCHRRSGHPGEHAAPLQEFIKAGYCLAPF